MKTKSLLLGSAAALVAVSGARAADAIIIPEPETVEYVRVCDAAGTGYFYIPGSETCMQITGDVIYEFDFNDDATDDDWNDNYEINLDFNTWTDTEYGAFTTSIQLGASAEVNEDAEVTVNEAFMTLGGLVLGYTDSFFDGGFGASDLDADAEDAMLVGYNFDLGGISIGIAAENDDGANWTPTFVANASATVGMIDLFGAVAVLDDEPGDWGAKVSASYDVTDTVALGVGAQYSADPSAGASDYITDYDWVVGASISADVTDKLTLGAGVDYGINYLGAGADDWLVELSASYAVTSNFSIGAAVDIQDLSSTTSQWDAEINFTGSF